MKINKLCGAFLGVLLSVSVGTLSVFADTVLSDLGEKIIDETRYSLYSFTDSVQSIVSAAGDVYARDWKGQLFTDNPVKNSAVSSLLVNQHLAEYANSSTNQSYTIQDSYTFIAKRRIVYPYDNMAETDYLFCYVDKNTSNTAPQTFGDVSISPNTCLLLRNTNFDGVKVCSIPLAMNEITINPGGSNSLFEFRFDVPDNNTFTTFTPDGTVTYQFRHSTGWNESGMTVINNQYNDIINENLLDTYTDSSTHYHYYIAEGDELNDLECLLGTGYAYEMGQGIMNGLQPWYLSSGYFNLQNYAQLMIDRTNNNINNTINPKYSPVYIVPDNSPFKSGVTINRNTVENYNDYGITYNNENNEFDLDIPVLAAALGAAITPTFEGIFDGTFDLQPEIGADFNLSPDLEFNWPDLVDDFINSITIQAPGWNEPYYPEINTEPYITGTIPSYSNYMAQTVDANVINSSGKALSMGWGFLDSLGLISLMIPLVIVGLLWRASGGE